MQCDLIAACDFERHSARWNALQHRAAPVPFLESLFIQPLLEEFGSGSEILAIASRNGSDCAAVILTRRRTLVWETFQPSQLPLGPLMVVPGTDLEELSATLIRHLPRLTLMLGLTQLDPLLLSRPSSTRRVQSMDYVPTASIEIDRPFETYWEERGKNLRSNIRKQRSKLDSEKTTTRLECIVDPLQVASAIGEYGRLESSGWKGTEGTAIHPANAQGRFYTRMLEGFCAQGRGRIYCYYFNDRIVAMDLCIENEDRIVILKTTYDESLKSVSPSTLMRQDEFRELFASTKLRRIEFYGKVMEWHTRWTANTRMLFHLTLHGSALVAKLLSWRR